MMTSVLITGGFGYLGGRLATFLAEKNCKIVLGSRSKMVSPAWLPEADVVQTDWASCSALSVACRGMDAVVHLAGMNAQECGVDPLAALEFNAIGTARLLQAAIEQGVKRFIYLSTAHVYGSPLVGDITEKTSVTSLHPYATSHRAAEDIVSYAHASGKIEGVVIRLSNAYGAPMHKVVNCWMLLVNDLCRQAVTTKKMVLNSSGLQRRDFIPMYDVCCAIEHLLQLPSALLGAGLFNVGGAWSPTVWEMAELIQARCEITLGYVPELTRCMPKNEETSPMLNYHCDALYQTNFKLISDKHSEIDQLLQFCQ